MEAGITEAPIAEAEEPTERIWEWNTWVHVGPGAKNCEQRTAGDCILEGADIPVGERHFHAWCRLPNQFAYRDIAVKAQAARARKMRQLRDPESDAAVILEDDLAALADTPEAMIDEINASKYGDIEEALREAREEKEFEHIDQDREELWRLRATPEDDRDEDALTSLERHVQKFDDTVARFETTRKARRRGTLTGAPVKQLVDQVRKIRVERQGLSEYMHTSNYWVWYVGTMTREGGDERKFSAIGKLTSAPGEIVHALQVAFGELEAHLSPAGTAGKGS